MERHKISAGIGIPSVLLIFIIMALMTFGILSVVTVRSDKKLTDLSAKKSAEYYKAMGKSEELLAVADDAAAKAASGDKRETFEARIKDNLKNTEIKTASKDGEMLLEWSVAVNKELCITTVAKPGEDGKSRCRIVSHKLQPIGEWQGDNRHLDVYGG